MDFGYSESTAMLVEKDGLTAIRLHLPVWTLHKGILSLMLSRALRAATAAMIEVEQLATDPAALSAALKERDRQMVTITQNPASQEG